MDTIERHVVNGLDIDELLDNASEKDLDILEEVILSGIVQESDGPESYAAFYKIITRTPCPRHIFNEVSAIYDTKAKDKGLVIWGHRGSWKTTCLTIIWPAYRIGKEPNRSNLIIQNNDSAAQDTTAAIAKIIEHHPGWKLVFPHVVPDKVKGWGAQGYEVMRSDIDYGDWVKQNAARKDPTLLGLGVASGSVIGKHPDGVLVLDDIHDESNTVSAAERAKVVQTLKSTILPLAIQDISKAPGQRMVTWILAVGTPWTEDDAYHYLKETGEFGFFSAPIMRPADETEPGAIQFQHKDLIGWYVMMWPERFPDNVVISLYNQVGKREFWRMFLLSLEGAEEIGIKYHSYPSHVIDMRWPTSGGLDYATTIEVRGKTMDARQRSKFALCWGMKLPTGGAVIYDGFVGLVSQLEAEGHVEKGQAMFPNYGQTGLEMDGIGAQFFGILQRKPHLRLLPFWTGGASKRNRHERELSPWLEMGMIKISDADTPFLNSLRKALREWPNGSLDEIDALYSFAKTVPDVLIIPNTSDSLPDFSPRARKKRDNPFAHINDGRHR